MKNRKKKARICYRESNRLFGVALGFKRGFKCRKEKEILQELVGASSRTQTPSVSYAMRSDLNGFL
jgi:hypothetical protein